MNFGRWFKDETDESKFPPLQETCEFLNGDHPFQVIWQTTTPQWYLDDPSDDHHVHIPERCSLPDSMVLHRRRIAMALRDHLNVWKPLFHDMIHFAPPAYHAFNGALVDMLSGGDNETGVQLAAAPQ